MPWETKKVDGGYVVVKIGDSKPLTKVMSKQKADANLRARYANYNVPGVGGKMPDRKAGKKVMGYRYDGKVPFASNNTVMDETAARKSKNAASLEDERLSRGLSKVPVMPAMKHGGQLDLAKYHEASDEEYDKARKRGMPGFEKGGKFWIAEAIRKPGALRRQLGVPKGEKIPVSRLASAAKKGGKLGKRARLAQTLSKLGD